MLHTILIAPWFHAGLGGLLAAGAVDYHAFLTWRSWKDAAGYSWGTASFRWVSGFVIAALGASTANAVLG